MFDAIPCLWEVLKGRPPGGLVVLPTTALVFDLGGTHLRCACLTREHELANFTQERIRSFRDGLSPSAIWEELLDKVVSYVSNSANLVESVAPLAMSFPGPLNQDGRIVNAPTVTGPNE